MMKSPKLLTAAILFVTMNVSAATVPNTFQAGQPALASEMNANFTALNDAITALEALNKDVTVDGISGVYQIVSFDTWAGIGYNSFFSDYDSNWSEISTGRGTFTFSGASSAVLSWTGIAHERNEYLENTGDPDYFPYVKNTHVRTPDSANINGIYTLTGTTISIVLDGEVWNGYVSKNGSVMVLHRSEFSVGDAGQGIIIAVQ